MIGAGPAGLAAALAASKTGERVILADQDFAVGGRLLSDQRTIDGQPASLWLTETEARLRAAPNMRILTRTTIAGVYDGGTYAGVERVSDHLATPGKLPRQRLWRIVAPRAVLATGAIERPLVFGGNDLPGVMLAGAVRSYVNRFAVKPGTRAVVFANNDDGASTITDLVQAGIEVLGLVDPRPEPSPALLHLAASHGIPVFSRSTIRQATGGMQRWHAWRSAAMLTASRSFAICSPCLAAGTRPSTSPPTMAASRCGTTRLRLSCQAPCHPACKPPVRLPARFACATQSSPGTAQAAAAVWRPQPARKMPTRCRYGRCPMPERKRSWISRTTSPPPTWHSPRERVLPPSNTSNATPRSAWPPTRARRPT